MKRPFTQKNVHQTLEGLAHFRTYFDGYANIANPFTELTRKNEPNIVTLHHIHQDGCDLLKSKLCGAPVLYTPTLSRPWCIQTDASGIAVAACRPNQ